MTFAGIEAVLCLFGSWTLWFYGFFVFLKILEAVNKAQPGEKRIELWNFSLDMRIAPWRLFLLYRRHYPSGKLAQRYWIATIAAMV